ncbi:MAG TPA: threonine/serine dehydratase [Terriglobia bacterium]|nr:threonine/serine dehydratase [Terriglobia bacterium]
MTEAIAVASIQTEDIPRAVRAAYRVIQFHVTRTPLVRSDYFSQRTGANVLLKLENQQVTSSFKARGAIHKILTLTEDERKRSVITASTGNHGVAVAYGLSLTGGQGIVFVPETASPVKVENIRRLGAEVRFHGTDSGQTEIFARRYAAEHGMIYISPYNDPKIIAGQGTLGLEVAAQTGRVDFLFASVGGGGLISGTAGYLKSVQPGIRIAGCSPENDPAMFRSIEAGKIVEVEPKPTLSDGSAGGVEPGAITFELCRTLVDHWVLVSEEEIAAAMRLFIENEHQLLEGAAGSAIAGFLKRASETPDEFKDKNVVLVICGARISLDALKSVL